MRKVLLGLFLLPFLAVMANQRTVEEAAEIAARFTNQQPRLRKALKAERKAADLRLAHQAMKNEKDEAAFYVFNQGEENGFVIVSADDRTAEQVLVYSDKGSFDARKINPTFKWWLSRFTEEISSIEDEVEQAYAPAATQEVAPIEPLLLNKDGVEITWAQESPYYIYCPYDQRDNTRCYTGCVATAAAQIMYKWRWPIKGTGESSYTWYDCLEAPDAWGNCRNSYDTVLSANYGETTYEWDLMLPAYQGQTGVKPNQRRAVAMLMYHCGVASEMNYGGDEAGGSGAWTDDMAYGLKTYFDYTFDKFISMYSETKYGGAHEGVTAEFGVTRDQFTTYFNADLEAGRPIIMGGEDSDGGHEFVCDGRDASNKFHINWGWEGDYNGYYSLSSLKPSGTNSNFSTNLDALIGLRPDTVETPVDPDPDPVTPGTGAFSLLSNLNNLEAGDEVILVSASKSKAAATISKTSSSSFFTAEDVTINNNTIDLSANSNVVIMTVGKSGDKWTFSDGDQLLVATAAKKVSFANSGNSGWTITISGGDATIQNQVDGNGRFLYNVNTPRFTTYTSDPTNAMLLPQIFYRKAGSATAIENTKAAAKAVKVMENGQIVIIRDNEKYTIFGQKIQ